MSRPLPTATQGPVVLRDPLEHVYSLVTEHGDVFQLRGPAVVGADLHRVGDECGARFMPSCRSRAMPCNAVRTSADARYALQRAVTSLMVGARRPVSSRDTVD